MERNEQMRAPRGATTKSSRDAAFTWKTNESSNNVDVLDCFLRGHMSARIKRVSWWFTVDPKCRFQAHTQLDHRPHLKHTNSNKNTNRLIPSFDNRSVRILEAKEIWKKKKEEFAAKLQIKAR